MNEIFFHYFIFERNCIMTYRTHLAVGYAAALAVTAPSTLSELITCLGVSTVGAVISDIDAASSESRKNLAKVISSAAAGIIAVFAADLFLGTDIVSKLRTNAGIMRIITGFVLFIAVCIFGENQPHRTFMHSVAGIAAVTFSFGIIIPSSVKYMAVSMTSHIIIDMLNRKRIRLLYPLRKPSFALGLCYADGKVNSILFLAALFVTISELIMRIIRIFHL